VTHCFRTIIINDILASKFSKIKYYVGISRCCQFRPIYMHLWHPSIYCCIDILPTCPTDEKYMQHNAIHTQKLKETWIQCQNIIRIILSKRVEYPAIASTVSSEVSISFFDTTNDRKSIKRRHATVKSICDVNWHNSNVFYVIIHCYRCNFLQVAKLSY